MARFVRRVTIVSLEGGKAVASHTHYKKKKKRKRKVSKWARPLEKAMRTSLKARDAHSTEALKRHHRSNRKRRNGFLRDAPLNMIRAHRKGSKKRKRLI